MACANSGATDSWVIFPVAYKQMNVEVRSYSSPMYRISKAIRTFALSLRGTVSNTTSSVRADLEMRSTAGPDRTPWDAKANTLRAPASFSNAAAVQRVPAVSTISSTEKHSLQGHNDDDDDDQPT